MTSFDWHCADGSYFLSTLSFICGLTYFLAWSASFYPQVYLNRKRKSVIGLSFDYLHYNLLGFTGYSIYNLTLFFSPNIKAANEEVHGTDSSVQISDVLFAVHAFALVNVQIFQCFIYEKGNQRISWIATVNVWLCWLSIVIYGELSATGVATWLMFIYWFSYLKVYVTLLKYIPQAYLNFKRKSTVGWHIGNVLLDFTGGVFSFAQMFVDALNQCNWDVFTNYAKVSLALISIAFDLLFMFQHYVLYRKSNKLNAVVVEEEIVTQSLRSMSNEGGESFDRIPSERSDTSDQGFLMEHYNSVKQLFRKFSSSELPPMSAMPVDEEEAIINTSRKDSYSK